MQGLANLSRRERQTPMNPGGNVRRTIYRSVQYTAFAFQGPVSIPVPVEGVTANPAAIAPMWTMSALMGCVFEKGLMEEANLREND